MKRLIFQEGKKYIFNDYFELNNSPEEIAAAFAYAFDTKTLALPLFESEGIIVHFGRIFTSKPSRNAMMKSLTSVLIAISLQFSSLAVFAAASSDTVPQVHVETNVGSFTVELYPKQAPKTVANFLQYARDGFYNGVIFHRLIAHYVAQAGSYDQNLSEKAATYQTVSNEADNGLSNLRGTIAMAREADPNSGSTQFFINLADNKSLDFSTRTRRGWGYAVFGRIIAGEEILDALDNSSVKPQGEFKYMPATPIIIQSMTVDESTVAASELPMVSKAEETAKPVDAGDADAAGADTTDTADAASEDNADMTEADSADNVDDNADATADADTTDSAEDNADAADAADADAADTDPEADNAAMEDEKLMTAAETPVAETPDSKQPKAQAQAKPNNVPKNLAKPSKSHLDASAKNLPEPPDLPAVP